MDWDNDRMELLERQPQIDELARLLSESGARAGKIAFVSGEAGAGKSALIERFARQAARDSRARVLWGHCDALQTSRVLGPVNEVLSGLALLPGAPEPSREQLFARVFDQFSQSSPVSLLVLEDLHWADDATLDFVRFFGRRVQRTRCLLVGTYRDDELVPTHPLRAVLGELTGQHSVRIRVPALSLEAVEELALGTTRDAGRIHQMTGGNPFFVRELLAASADTVPETVRDAVLARLMPCSPAARELAELVSLLPGKTEIWLVRALAGDVDTAVDEAVMRGLLRQLDDALAFRHEIGRLAVESTIPRARARALHERILQSLIERNADLSRLVHHASHAQNAEVLLRYAPRAAEQAACAGAHREAAAHLTVALRHVDSLDARERASLLERHAIECDVTNQGPASLASATQVLVLWRELGDVSAQARALVLIGRQYWKAGKTALADQHVAQAIAQLETLPPGRDLAMAYSARSQLAMTNKRVAENLEYAQRALDLAAQFGDFGVQSHALTNIGGSLLPLGEARGLEALERSLAIALEHDLQQHAGRAYANLVSILVRQRSALAERYLLEGERYCDEHDVLGYLLYIRAYGAVFRLGRGEWDEAERSATEILERGDALVPERVPCLLVLALVRARRGDPDVDPLLEEAEKLASSVGEAQRIVPVAAARAEVAWYRGDLDQVGSQVTVGLKALAGCRDPWRQGRLAMWGRYAGPPVNVTAELDESYALMVSGDWKRAAAVWQQRASPYERALALASGSEEDLREALTILEKLKAGPLAAMVRRRLRELGARGIPRGPRASTRVSPGGLTAREVEVLAVLAHGHTNGQIARQLHLSAKTVDHHVCAILRKLEVHSRTQAVTTAFGRGILKMNGSGAKANG